jgi:LuxR family transcriptional regulator, maltose regulon positive regulatory protein
MSSHSLLATKLWLPTPRLNLVARPQLIARLQDHPERKLTLIAAPAGFGKTTLLAEWLQAEDAGQGAGQYAFAWLSLDEHDNDALLFWRYLTAALQTVDDGLGETAAALLESPQPPESRFVLTSLINDIAGRDGRLILILDDYHVIHNRAIHDGLAYLIERQPPQLHLVITSRADPPLPLARLRARQQMQEIRAADLRFTLDEAAAFLHQIWKLPVDPAQIAALESRTEGWIAGLQLAALAMQPLNTPQEIADFVAHFTGSHRYVLDYLVDETLRGQPAAMQDFLLQSSILDRFCADLCQATLQVANAADLLAQAEASNLFLVALDGRRQWFRYHQLFADLLRHRLKQIRPDLLPILHQRSSQWHEQHGFTEEAMRHALAANDPARAAALVESVRWEMRNRGETAALRRWLDLLPTTVVENSGPLAVSYAWALLMGGEMAAAEAYLGRVIVPLLPQAPADADWPAEVAVMRGEIALGQRQFHEAVSYCTAARDKIPIDQPRFRGALENILGYAYQMQGQLDLADQSFATAAEIAAQTNNRFSLLSARAGQARLMEVRGRLCEAESLWRTALPLVMDRRERPMPIAGLVQAGLARVYYEWNRVDEALALAETAVQLGHQFGLGPVLLYGALALSQTRQARGDQAGAHQVLAQAGQALGQSRMALLDLRFAAAAARLWLRQGDLAPAAAWADQFAAQYGLEPAADPGDWFEFEYALLARIWLAQARLPQTADLLAELSRGAEKGGRTGHLIEALALQARVQQAQGETDEAVGTLSRALTLAEPEGYVRLFVDEGRPMGELLARIVVGKTAVSDYAARLLAAFEAEPVTGGAEPAQKVTETAVTPQAVIAHWLVEPLSERELEALQLVAEGLTNRQIGERLYISTATVKKHMENIYGKLHVRNRTQAVARARELGLLA